MPNPKMTGLLTSVLLFSSMSAAAEFSSLRVTVKDAATTTGTVEVSLFVSSESFLKEAFLQRSGQLDENGTFVAEFAGLEEGETVMVHTGSAGARWRRERGSSANAGALSVGGGSTERP